MPRASLLLYAVRYQPKHHQGMSTTTYPYALSVIIPAYNESRRLPKTVRAISKYLRARRVVHEVIVVDDGSRDDTPQLLVQLAKEGVTVLGDGRNYGKGAALRAGVMAARGELVLMTDADLSTPIEELDKLMPRIMQSGFDVAIGSRAMAQSEVRQPLARKILSRASNLLIRMVLNLPYRDTQCGFKLYRLDAARRLFSTLALPRFSFDYEILLRAKRTGLRVAEVGVRWEHAPFSTVRGIDVLQSLVDVFRVRFAMDKSGAVRTMPGAEALRFGAVGLINTLVDTSVYLVLTRFTAAFADAPVGAKLFGFLAASVCSLYLNRYWTFKLTAPLTFAEVARFYTAASVGLVVNVGSMYALVYVAHLYDLWALAATTVVTFIVNYTLSRLWVFKKQSPTTLAAYTI